MDIDAVDTHRPKPSKTAAAHPSASTSTGHQKKPSFKANATGDNLSIKLPVGASGEIVKDAMSPILPISPKLYPRGVSIKDTNKSSSATTTLATSNNNNAPANDGEMAALDLGDAAIEHNSH